jgi:hypothetical protein
MKTNWMKGKEEIEPPHKKNPPKKKTNKKYLHFLLERNIITTPALVKVCPLALDIIGTTSGGYHCNCNFGCSSCLRGRQMTE